MLELVAKAGALAVGPGLGRSEGTKAFVRRVLAEAALPAVVDGDALWELEPGDWPAPRVLTPHSGELGRLIERKTPRGSMPIGSQPSGGRSTASSASSCSRATGR